MADDQEVVLEHPDLLDDPDAQMTLRQSEGFWQDKLDQIEVFKQSGWREVKARRPAAAPSTEEKK